jgi:DNA-binding MarR family transcriptional regulator
MLRPEMSDALEALLVEAHGLVNRSRGSALWDAEPGELPSTAQSVLAGLNRYGPQTVPQIARSRLTSRQTVQVTVNRLLADRYVGMAENPAHRRSGLVCITAEGKAVVEIALKREGRLYELLPAGISEKEVHAATAVLRRIRQRLAQAGLDETQGTREGGVRGQKNRSSKSRTAESADGSLHSPRKAEDRLIEEPDQSRSELEELPVNLL